MVMVAVASTICYPDRIWNHTGVLGPSSCLWGIIILIVLSWDNPPTVLVPFPAKDPELYPW